MAKFGVQSRMQFRSGMGRFRALTEAAAQEALEEEAEYVRDRARALAPGPRSGRLAESIDTERRGKSMVVRADVDHAAPLEEGARPHQIPGAFGRPEGVWHPGNRPFRFLRRALRGSAKRLIARLDKKL